MSITTVKGIEHQIVKLLSRQRFVILLQLWVRFHNWKSNAHEMSRAELNFFEWKSRIVIFDAGHAFCLNKKILWKSYGKNFRKLI